MSDQLVSCSCIPSPYEVSRPPLCPHWLAATLPCAPLNEGHGIANKPQGTSLMHCCCWRRWACFGLPAAWLSEPSHTTGQAVDPATSSRHPAIAAVAAANAVTAAAISCSRGLRVDDAPSTPSAVVLLP